LSFFFVFLRRFWSVNPSRWVSTPITFGKPCTWKGMSISHF
jgi:hypothetical protein